MTPEVLKTFFADVLEQEATDGRAKLANSYYTDMFHPEGPRNVGQDVIDAVGVIQRVGNEVLAGPDATVEHLLLQLSMAKPKYAVEYEDPDGFGLATFNRVIQKLVAFAKEQGQTVHLTVEQLTQSAAHLVEAELYAKGFGGLEDLVEMYKRLAPEQAASVDAVLERQLKQDKKMSPLAALDTVDLIRRFYQKVGRDDQEAKLLHEKMELMHVAYEQMKQQGGA